MSTVRVSALLAAFAVIALIMVGLRVEQTRLAARTLMIEAEWVQARRELWHLQTRAARLRAPGRLHKRMTWCETDLVPPAPSETGHSGTRVVLNQP